MKTIVRSNYPIAKLPEELREGMDRAGTATVTVTFEQRPEKVMSLEEIWAMRRPPYRTMKEITAEMRRQRNEWER
jgi:hypothetical protein